jgi:hypothetical protein
MRYNINSTKVNDREMIGEIGVQQLRALDSLYTRHRREGTKRTHLCSESRRILTTCPLILDGLTVVQKVLVVTVLMQVPNMYSGFQIQTLAQ